MNIWAFSDLYLEGKYQASQKSDYIFKLILFHGNEFLFEYIQWNPIYVDLCNLEILPKLIPLKFQ